LRNNCGRVGKRNRGQMIKMRMEKKKKGGQENYSEWRGRGNDVVVVASVAIVVVVILIVDLCLVFRH